jgi:hypothetical protein
MKIETTIWIQTCKIVTWQVIQLIYKSQNKKDLNEEQ